MARRSAPSRAARIRRERSERLYRPMNRLLAWVSHAQPTANPYVTPSIPPQRSQRGAKRLGWCLKRVTLKVQELPRYSSRESSISTTRKLSSRAIRGMMVGLLPPSDFGTRTVNRVAPASRLNEPSRVTESRTFKRADSGRALYIQGLATLSVEGFLQGEPLAYAERCHPAPQTAHHAIPMGMVLGRIRNLSGAVGCAVFLPTDLARCYSTASRS